MTRKVAERAANALHELAMAAVIGSAGDWVIVGTRLPIDIAGLGFGVLLFAWSLALTRQLGGPRL